MFSLNACIINETMQIKQRIILQQRHVNANLYNNNKKRKKSPCCCLNILYMMLSGHNVVRMSQICHNNQHRVRAFKMKSNSVIIVLHRLKCLKKHVCQCGNDTEGLSFFFTVHVFKYTTKNTTEKRRKQKNDLP